MVTKLQFFIVLLPIVLQTIEGIKLLTLKQCCERGTNYANSGLKCSTFQTPIAGVSKEDEPKCLNSIQICCKNEYRDKQCNLGKDDAKNGKDCVSSEDTTAGDFRKDCCQACQYGIETGTISQSCQSGLGLGEPYDSAFFACCKEILVTTPSIPPTSTTTKQPPSSATTTSVNLESVPPSKRDMVPPPIENLCDFGEVCAQICIPTKDSYKCDCHKGYTLMADGVSCKQDKRPPMKSNRCMEHNPCEHTCTDTGVAIQCSCHEGYKLAKDKRTCKDIDECALGNHDCLPHEICINEEGNYYCEDPNELEDDLSAADFDSKCPEGYKFDGENKLCNDIDECEIGIICPRPKLCINTVGSFRCEGDDMPKCPPGFYFKDSIQDCEDIDECITGQDDCNRESQTCLNTKGNFTCIDKASKRSCPPGFKKNPETQACDDINECEENEELCGPNESCVNEPGGHTCIPKSLVLLNPTGPMSSGTNQPNSINPYLSPVTYKITSPKPTVAQSFNPYSHPTPTTTEKITKPPTTFTASTTTTTTTTTTTVKPPTKTPYQPIQSIPEQSYSERWKPPTKSYSEEPEPSPSSREYPKPSQQPQPSRETYPYSQQPQPTIKQPYPGQSTHDQPYYAQRNFYRPQSPTPSERPYSQYPSTPTSCPSGYKYSYEHGRCVDIDECIEDGQSCDSNQDCYNTAGGFVCNCKSGFTKDYTTGACVDINECQVGAHDCIDGQRCDNTIGSYLCSRTAGCGTGYTLNYASGLCEDDDECDLGTHNCNDLGSKFQCKNTLGSYRCQRISISRPEISRYIPPKVDTNKNYPIFSGQNKKCLPGYIMNRNGDCEDINECESNPCGRGEKCRNLNGRYQCISAIQCKLGYELNEVADGCVDVNECSRGLHKCSSTQVCKNGPGYYMCECPPGHKLNKNHCEDINECEHYRGRICSPHAECINTIGSYRCRCKDGLRERGQNCADIDECEEIPGLCQQTCVNIWGGYRCSCERGYTLNTDNRTCADVNECEKFRDKHLCIGTCENTPGSYICKCPPGYRLGTDGRTCQDIDECQENICQRPDAICLNTRGSYKCHTIVCPPHYIRDPEHKSRCKRAPNVCDGRDLQCMQLPQQYSYHFMTFVSRLPIIQGHIDFFQMKGPGWPTSSADFSMKIMNVRCPTGVEKVDDTYFKMSRFKERALISIVRSIEGPQEIELQLEMRLFYKGIFNGMVVAKIFIIVSEYQF